MQLVVPEQALSGLRIPDDEAYWEFCVANPDVRFERTAKGEIVIVPPAGGEGAFRELKLSTQLDLWAEKNGRGTAFGASIEFILPSGAAYSPDAAWVSNAELEKLSKERRRNFLPLCPEFVVEVMSPSHRLKDAKAKMREWMENGVQLGWLIDGDHETVYIYRAGKPEPEKQIGVRMLKGEGPVAGFQLDLLKIWAGL